MSQTVYAKAVPEGVPFEQIEWRPWVNVKESDLALLPNMILRRWIRGRGGVHPDERFTVTVYTYDDDTPKHPNGKPKECKSIVFTVNYQEPK